MPIWRKHWLRELGGGHQRYRLSGEAKFPAALLATKGGVADLEGEGGNAKSSVVHEHPGQRSALPRGGFKNRGSFRPA